MANFQVLENIAAKFVLNLPNRESSTKAFNNALILSVGSACLSDERSTDVLLCSALFILTKSRILSISLTHKDKIIINTTLEAH